MRRNPEGIAEAIRPAKSIAICSHVSPDGDTVGCALAMRLGLQALGKQVAVFCADKIPNNLAMLPGADTFRDPLSCDETFDLLLAVDVSDQERLGTGKRLLSLCSDTAQIDHHPTNPLYMRVNSVDGAAPAASVLVAEQLKTLGLSFTREIAMCLYTGLSTDTGNFSFSATTGEVFQIMSELMVTGFPLSELSRVLFREKSREQLLLLGRAIASLRFEGNGRLAVMKLTCRDFSECGALSEHADTIVNYGLETTGTRMALLAREDGDGMIKLSLRAKSPEVISDVAQKLGGGGHPQAAGISMPGSLDEVADQVAAEMIRKLEMSRE